MGYYDEIKKRQMKDGNLASILRSTILFYKAFGDDDDLMELVNPIMKWFQDRGLVTIEEEDYPDNVIDFMAEKEKRQILRGETDGI